MSISSQARQLGVSIKGRLTPVEGKDRHCKYYVDAAGNTFILYRGILTVVTAEGRVL